MKLYFDGDFYFFRPKKVSSTSNNYKQQNIAAVMRLFYFMKTKFNLDRFMAYQLSLVNKFKCEEIDAREYFQLANFQKEATEMFQKVESIKKWITENNLPFDVQWIDMNIQVQYMNNTKFLKYIEDGINHSAPE